MNISALKNRIRSTTVELPDDLGTITISYRPVNSELQKKLMENQARYANGNQVERAAADLSEMLTAWDVTSDGGPVQPTYELLRTFDLSILNAISSAITEHQFPPRKASATSGAGS